MADDSLTSEQQDLVRKNMDLAHSLARDSWNKNPEGMELEEVVSVAYHGLVKAALRFNPNHFEKTDSRFKPELAFVGFAKRWISGAILEWQRTEDHVQRSYRQIYKQLVIAGYDKKNLEQIAPLMKEPLSKLQAVVHAVENPYVSLDETIAPGVSHPKFGEVASDHDVESSALEVSITHAVQETHNSMSEQKQLIIALRYYANLEFQAIAMEMNVSLHYVRELHTEAILDLHEAMVSRVQDTN